MAQEHEGSFPLFSHVHLNPVRFNCRVQYTSHGVSSHATNTTNPVWTFFVEGFPHGVFPSSESPLPHPEPHMDRLQAAIVEVVKAG